MKKYIYILFLQLLGFAWNMAEAQDISIVDTAYDPNFRSTDRSFNIEGYVNGVDSGSLTVSINDFSFSVPVRNEKFYIYGVAQAVEKGKYILNGDYYINSFFVEPGSIKIECDTINRKYKASGTKENNAANYFYDTLFKPISKRFDSLVQKREQHLASRNIDDYIKITDSISSLQKEAMPIISNAIDRELFGYYLLDVLNTYYIRNELFHERKALFDNLPNYLKNSNAGRSAYDYLLKTDSLRHPQTYSSPSLSLYDKSGREYKLNELYKKKVIVLDFWASWCVPCIKALPMLTKIQTMDISRDVQFISISIDKNKDDWIRGENKLSIPLWMAGSHPTIAASFETA